MRFSESVFLAGKLLMRVVLRRVVMEVVKEVLKRVTSANGNEECSDGDKYECSQDSDDGNDESDK